MRLSFPGPSKDEGMARRETLPFATSARVHWRTRGASRRAMAASYSSRAALSAAIGLPGKPSDTALVGTVPFRAPGKAKDFAPSASSSQEVLVPPGGDRHRPSAMTAFVTARGRRIPPRLHDAS